jgi:uncharacterized repeat protein (TIGR03803 family)
MAAKTFRAPKTGRQFFKHNLSVEAIMAAALLWLAASPAQASVTFSNLVTFNGTNGANPSAGLVQGTDGSFYGTTYDGGANGDGTVFKMTPIGVLTTLVSFNGTNGANPSGALAQGTNGNFYGTTSAGGTNGGYGTVFEITPAGVLTSLVSFNNTNGADPAAPLVLGTNGIFYGTTYYGGASGNNGTVFQMTPAGVMTTMVSFNDADGANPQAPLTQGPDGNFYGTTAAGGTYADKGTVFRMTSSGALTSLISFNGTNGEFPSAGLTLGSDGNFYGATAGGGATGDINGTLFRMTVNGVLTTLVSFNNTNGAAPYDSPVQGLDGSFYGTTSAGGASNNNFGTIFEVTANGAMASLYSFTGSFPYAGLLLGNDGNFYGTTYGGADFPNGAIFRVTIPPLPVIESMAQNGSTVAVTWSAVIGQKYQVQYSTSLNPPNWQSLGSPVTATSVSMSASDSTAANPQCFYRVALLP